MKTIYLRELEDYTNPTNLEYVESGDVLDNGKFTYDSTLKAIRMKNGDASHFRIQLDGSLFGRKIVIKGEAYSLGDRCGTLLTIGATDYGPQRQQFISNWEMFTHTFVVAKPGQCEISIGFFADDEAGSECMLRNIEILVE